MIFGRVHPIGSTSSWTAQYEFAGDGCALHRHHHPRQLRLQDRSRRRDGVVRGLAIAKSLAYRRPYHGINNRIIIRTRDNPQTSLSKANQFSEHNFNSLGCPGFHHPPDCLRIARLAQDITGGLMGDAALRRDFDHAEVGEKLPQVPQGRCGHPGRAPRPRTCMIRNPDAGAQPWATLTESMAQGRRSSPQASASRSRARHGWNRRGLVLARNQPRPMPVAGENGAAGGQAARIDVHFAPSDLFLQGPMPHIETRADGASCTSHQPSRGTTRSSVEMYHLLGRGLRAQLDADPGSVSPCCTPRANATAGIRLDQWCLSLLQRQYAAVGAGGCCLSLTSDRSASRW